MFSLHPALCTLLLVDFLVLLGQVSAVVVVSWWFTSNGGVQAVATLGVVVAAAAFIAAPAISPFGERLCKGRQISWGLGGLCLVALLQLGMSLAGQFWLGWLLALSVLQVLATSFVDPARETVLAELAPAGLLPAAIRARKTLRALAGVIGPLLAGALIAVAGVPGALALYAGLLLTSTLVATRIPRTTMAARGAFRGRQWWGELRAGLTAKWRMPMERGWTMVNFAVWIFQGPAVGLLIPLKVQALGLHGGWLGMGIGALSLGVLLGSAVGAQWLVDRLGRYRVRVGLGLLEGIALAAVGLSTTGPAMLAALMAAGFCNAAMSLVGATHRALAIPQDYRVRMFAAGSMATQVAGAIGPALVGVALARFSVASVHTAWGLLMAGCVLGFLLVPRFKEFLALEHAQVADWYRVQYPGVFRA